MVVMFATTGKVFQEIVDHDTQRGWRSIGWNF